MNEIKELTYEEKIARVTELKKLIYKVERDYDYYKALNMSFKLVMNSSYGALANRHFVLSNSHIANAITSMGRDIIKYMMMKIEDYFYNQWHLDTETHTKLKLKTPPTPIDDNPKFTTDSDGLVHYTGSKGITIYGDTDSESADTLVSSESGKCTIEDFYNRNVKNGSAGITSTGHESVNTTEKVLNWSNNNKIYYGKVKRIIRHKVTKEKWMLKTKDGSFVTVTSDHNLVVFRDGIQLNIKPRDVLKTDKVLKIYEKN